MPAAAVIPAPVAYVNVAAVKTPVVEGRADCCRCLVCLFDVVVASVAAMLGR